MRRPRQVYGSDPQTVSNGVTLLFQGVLAAFWDTVLEYRILSVSGSGKNAKRALTVPYAYLCWTALHVLWNRVLLPPWEEIIYSSPTKCDGLSNLLRVRNQ